MQGYEYRNIYSIDNQRELITLRGCLNSFVCNAVDLFHLRELTNELENYVNLLISSSYDLNRNDTDEREPRINYSVTNPAQDNNTNPSYYACSLQCCMCVVVYEWNGCYFSPTSR